MHRFASFFLFFFNCNTYTIAIVANINVIAFESTHSVNSEDIFLIRCINYIFTCIKFFPPADLILYVKQGETVFWPV